MSKITKLTPEQEAKMVEYRDKWLAIGLSTERVDPVAATAAINLMYSCGGLKHPKEIKFVRGPKEAKAALMAAGIKDSILDSAVYGCNEAGWLSFYDFFATECGVKNIDSITGLIAVAKTCGWVCCYDDLAVVQDRPLLIKMDDQNRLHCEDGAAILYADGFAVYSWHGVRVPDEWIEDRSTLTAKIALTWDNTEQRRAACEILGWINVLKSLKAKVIDEDPDPMIGTLLEVNIPDIGKEKFIKVVCGTGREFAIPVPPNMKTALEANAWTYDIDPDILKQLEVRT